MSEKRYDFIAIGEALVDLISDQIVPALNQAEQFQRFLGGEAANVAFNMTLLGGQAALVACVGEDGFGNYIRQQLDEAGVATEYVGVTSQAPTTVAVNARQTATPDFIIYRGADAQFSPRRDTWKRSRPAVWYTRRPLPCLATRPGPPFFRRSRSPGRTAAWFPWTRTTIRASGRTWPNLIFRVCCWMPTNG